MNGWHLAAVFFCLIAGVGVFTNMEIGAFRAIMIIALISYCLACHFNTQEKIDRLEKKIDQLTEMLKKS